MVSFSTGGYEGEWNIPGAWDKWHANRISILVVSVLTSPSHLFEFMTACYHVGIIFVLCVKPLIHIVFQVCTVLQTKIFSPLKPSEYLAVVCCLWTDWSAISISIAVPCCSALWSVYIPVEPWWPDPLLSLFTLLPFTLQVRLVILNDTDIIESALCIVIIITHY